MSQKAAGTLVLAHNTGRVLLMRRSADQGWDQPGGHLDPADDGDPVANAVREFEEETGADAAGLDCRDSFAIRRLPDGSHVTYMPRPPVRADLEYTVFVCTFPTEFAPTLSHEHTEWGWFDVGAPPEDTIPGTMLALQVLRQKGY